MSLLDELRAGPPRRVGCSVCHWLQSRPEDEQAEWSEALSDPTISNTAILRAMVKRDAALKSTNAIGTHRNGGH